MFCRSIQTYRRCTAQKNPANTLTEKETALLQHSENNAFCFSAQEVHLNNVARKKKKKQLKTQRYLNLVLVSRLEVVRLLLGKALKM